MVKKARVRRDSSFRVSPSPVVASGGAGHPEHLREVLTEGKADAALVASMVHYGDFTIRDIKRYLHEQGVKVRLEF